MNPKIKLLAASVSALFMSACANLTTNQDLKRDASSAAQRLAQQERQRDTAPKGFAEHTQGHFVDFDVAPSHPFAGDVGLQVTDAPFGPVLIELARKSGYEAVFTDNMDLRRPLTISVDNVSPKYAMRQVASAVGYVAVIDEAARTVTIADKATYVFKLPMQLLNAAGANFSTGGNPMASSGSGGSDSSSGVSASFNIRGEVKPATSKSFLEQMKTVAGEGAEVSLNEENGMLTVRGSAQALNRASRYVANQVKEASAQVWVEATVLEVALTKDFSVGVDWGKIFNSSNGLSATLRGGAGASEVGGLSVAYTTANSRTVVDALMDYAEVRIISNPTVMMTNHVPSSIFQGRSDPYLPSVSTTTTGTSGTTSTSAQAEFATSGLLLSAVADVIDDRRVQMTLMPVLTRVEGFEEMDAGDAVLRVPVQSSSSTTLRVTAETGRTLIIGGIRTNSGGRSQGLGRLGNDDKATELIIMVRARVMPVEVADPVVAELL